MCWLYGSAFHLTNNKCNPLMSVCVFVWTMDICDIPTVHPLCTSYSMDFSRNIHITHVILLRDFLSVQTSTLRLLFNVSIFITYVPRWVNNKIIIRYIILCILDRMWAKGRWNHKPRTSTTTTTSRTEEAFELVINTEHEHKYYYARISEGHLVFTCVYVGYFISSLLLL